jgi:hypothetical protein
MRFAKNVFTIAGIWGIVILTPFYFLFDALGRWYPPPITHPEFYFGFVGVGLAWQIAFLVIGRDPVRFRPLMIPAVLEKGLYVGSLIVLYGMGRLPADQLGPVIPDSILGMLFLAAFVRLRPGGAVTR